MSQKKKKGKKQMSALMAVLMSVSTTLTPVNSTAFELETSSVAVESTMEEITAEPELSTAEETKAVNEIQTSSSETEAITEEITEEAQTEIKTESETEAEIETEMKTESELENETKEEVRTNLFESLDPTSGFSELDLAEIDFSSKRLLVAADESVIIDLEHVLSSYAGVYLLQYETQTQAKYAYAYYYSRSEFVDVDTVISVADGDGCANAAALMAADENPIAQLQEAVAENPVKAVGAVAVIDTGVNDVTNVTESVSMIGDNPADENGHGTKMAQLVASQNPNVSILSIKALGADGTGNVSAVYAAIQYAIDKQVSVINLSMSALGTAENAALTSIVNDAVSTGIAVIGAAGNNGHDARFYVPGSIESAYIVGAADENGARIASSNFGSTVDFNVVAMSTSEAAATFSGYYTENGAVTDEKIVFPTDYVKEENRATFDGPDISHQISYYDYKGSMTDFVWIAHREVKTSIDKAGDYFTTYIGFLEDVAKVQELEVCVDFMNLANERKITNECIVDLENMLVKIPMSYKDADITVRWYMTNASYGYAYDVDANYIMSDTPEPFRTAKNENDQISGLDFDRAWNFVQGTWATGFTHTPDSMNHSYVNYSLEDIKEKDSFTIQDGYMAIIDDTIDSIGSDGQPIYHFTSRKNVSDMFGENALRYYIKDKVTKQNIPSAIGPNELAFLTHFHTVTRNSDEADVSNWFNTIGGRADGTVKVDTNIDGEWDYLADANLGWVFGTCAYDYLDGRVPCFQDGGQIICTNKDDDGTAYFFYYCKSYRGQYAGGSFSLTPILPKTGFLQIYKESSDTTMTEGNSCYSLEGITYKVYSDSTCTVEIETLTLDANGYSQSIELTEGTYYIKETDAVNSGYALDSNIHEVTVKAGTTAGVPQIWKTKDTPLNDPLGIVINKMNGDGTTTADLSGAEYTITYYPKKYDTVSEIQTDPEAKPTVWVIQTRKADNANYRAILDDEHIVPGSEGPIFGKNYTGSYIIPLGTITIEETKAPVGFSKDGATVSNLKTGEIISGTNNVYLFQFVDENSAVYLKSGNVMSNAVSDETSVTLTYAEVQNRAGIHLVKYDATTGGIATGDGDLSGIKFAIVNNTGSDIVNYAGYTIANGEVAQVIITNSEGYAATGPSDLPVGSYIVRELRMDARFDGQTLYEGYSPLANSWYQWQDNQDTVTLTDDDTNGFVWAKTFYDYPVAGTLVMEKHDLELNKKAVMGGTSFEGIVFEIYNGSDNAVVIDGTSYAKDEVVATAVSDADGTITTTATFPVGRYYVKEASVNSQYTLTDGEAHYFSVISGDDGAATVKYENDQNAVIFNDRVVRGDLSFVKKNAETDETLAYIPFQITNNTTSETHYILTGADGSFTSATGKTTNTNANDEVLSQYGERDVIPQGVIDSLTKDAGLWFGLGSEGTMTDANDSYGSFVYGTYTITELKTEATRNMKMYTNTFTIDTDGKVLDLGTVNNIPMGIGTTLVDGNGKHFTEALSNVVLTDHVSYRNLDTDKTYTLTGTLYVKDGDAITALVTETVDFQPTEASGIQDVIFTIDASELKGKSLVAFEELSVNGEFCAEHKDKDDENQTVTFPDLQTTARDSVTEDHVSNPSDSVSIIDTVSYSGLKVGETYTITGTLMDVETKAPALDDDGNEITAEKQFTAPAENGTVDIIFTFAGVSLAGKTIVAFENIYYEDKLYAVHADINDKNQTIYFPEIRTKALDANTGLNQVLADSNATVVDTVTYTHLLPGKTYTMKGVLMTSAGNALMVNGKTITASTEFVPTTSDGTVDVTFNFDASEIGGRKLVFYEYLELDGNTVASHTDISDTDQTIYVPSIKTTIIDSENGSHNSAADKEVTLIDTVRYNGVEIGRTYTVSGTLIDKETQKEILDDNGNKITASTEFTAEKTNGTVDVVFKFSGVSLAGKIVVAFEHMYTEGKEVAVHANLRDEGQTAYFPSVHTTATSNDTQDHVTGSNEKVTITDQVSMKALKIGTEYTISGTLMDATTGKPIMVDGKTITSRRTFTADAHDMTVSLTYTLNASELAGTTTVVFENLYSDGALLAQHEDLKDDEQMVYIPKIHTTAKDKINGINHTESAKTATIIDTIFYTNLLQNRSYVVSGKLMNKATGEPILIGGKEVTASTTFTPTKAEGSVDVTFTFDATAVAPETVVVYETLNYKDIKLAAHEEISDAKQTVYIPTIKTSAISDDTKDHITKADNEITMTDTVSYKGLEVGREYQLQATLMNRATGKAITSAGKTVTASTTFTPTAKDGAVNVTFKFDGTGLEDTITVVFERLYTEGKEVAIHADLSDENQAVYLPKIRTNAEDAVTEINHTEAKPKAKIIDSVKYSSVLVGKEYIVTGKLINKETGKAILVNGKEITASTTFKAEKTSGSVDVVFEFDASVLEGTTIVAYESMTYKGVEVAIHADITDKDQTVYIPKVRTTAIGADTKDHVTEAKKDVTIVDTVSYEGLEVGREYTVKGVLMNKATGKAITVNSKEVTAESTFTAKAQKGTVDVTFKFDGSALEDTLLVAFETLYTENKEVGVHADTKDDAQTVYLPKIRTHAKDATTEIDHTEALEKATIIDTVTYSSLLPGKEYTIKGTLMNKETGEAVLINGEPITASTTFTAEKSSGSVDLIFTFDASAIAGTTVVAFESVEYKGIEVGVHADITDEDQTVYIPDVHTTATALDTEDHVTKANEEVTITDEVALTGLKVGSEYTVKGVLMDQTTGKELTVNDKIITAEVTFAADERDMTVTLTYTLDASKLAGTTTVIYETLYTEGKEVGKHHEIKDEGQTVYIPEIHTTAEDLETKINHTEAKDQATIVDTVLYSHLLPGKEYTVKGTLMNKATGEPILIDGNEVTAETTFTAEKADGSVDVIFTFDASKIAGTTIVAFETLEYQEIEIAVHADIEDEDQTVYVPDIHTTAVGEDTKDHIEKAKEDVVIVDTVSYKSLEVGREYTVKGTLMDKETGEPLVIDEEEVVAETTFTPETTDGSVDVTFTFDASALAGKTYVAFETLYTEDKEVAIHTDIEDEDQTVSIPDVYTMATDKVTGDHDGVVAEETTVLDEVFYKNLIPGKEYTVNGKLMVKETGEPLTVNGEEVTASKTFIAEEADGSVIIEFTFNSLALAGKHVVAFEDLTYEGISIASHEDLEDEDQTISYPELHTNAVDRTSGSKTMTVGTNVTLVDTVTYKGLTKDKTYIVKGTIMDKASSQPIGVTAESTFTAEETDGSVEVTFTFDTSLLQGKTLVVFEELYDEDGNKIIVHNDLNDADQTVTVPAKPQVPPVVTGDDSTPMPYVAALIALLLAAAAVVLVLVRRRKQA